MGKRRRKNVNEPAEKTRTVNASAKTARNKDEPVETVRGEIVRDSGNRQVSSITRKLHFYFIRKRTALLFFADLVLLFCIFIAFLAGCEYSRFGAFMKDYSRDFIFIKKTVVYLIRDEAGKTALRINLTPFLTGGGIGFASVFGLQVIGILPGYAREDRKIRRILNPINEIALRADELSRLSFTEDKYHLLEDAIDKIEPDSVQQLSFGDSDLVGVEAAMNNLLIRMQDSYRQQARFVNDASHELRTPIAVIQGYANMLDRWGKKDEKILDESIAAILHESDHMNHLVEQLLFLARGDSGKTTLKKEPTDLNAMMQEVYEESFMIDEAHPYRFRPSEESLTVEADPGLLKQAVRILIDNAAKYTAPGDEIILSCGKTGDGEAYLQVQDTGMGMAEKDVRHMFERFYRSDETRSLQGTGLGLSIAKWIVDKHGGHFEILSRTQLGTRIRVVVPDRRVT